jgi:hypothetical protein
MESSEQTLRLRVMRRSEETDDAEEVRETSLELGAELEREELSLLGMLEIEVSKSL